MRVITGTARGRKLETLEGNDVRPTTDKVKEAIFSAIQFDIDGAEVLDLFAGSGQLGIEALSRGAKSAVFVDNSKRSLDIVSRNLETTGFKERSVLYNMNSVDFLQTTNKKFDIVFLDPPYKNDILVQILPIIENKMNSFGKVICEHEKNLKLPEEINRLRLKKNYKYGKIEVTMYCINEGDE